MRTPSCVTTFDFQGARWDINIGSIADSRLKELHPSMPVMYIKAVTQVYCRLQTKVSMVFMVRISGGEGGFEKNRVEAAKKGITTAP